MRTLTGRRGSRSSRESPAAAASSSTGPSAKRKSSSSSSSPSSKKRRLEEAGSQGPGSDPVEPDQSHVCPHTDCLLRARSSSVEDVKQVKQRLKQAHSDLNNFYMDKKEMWRNVLSLLRQFFCLSDGTSSSEYWFYVVQTHMRRLVRSSKSGLVHLFARIQALLESESIRKHFNGVVARSYSYPYDNGKVSEAKAFLACLELWKFDFFATLTKSRCRDEIKSHWANCVRMEPAMLAHSRSHNGHCDVGEACVIYCCGHNEEAPEVKLSAMPVMKRIDFPACRCRSHERTIFRKMALTMCAQSILELRRALETLKPQFGRVSRISVMPRLERDLGARVGFIHSAVCSPSLYVANIKISHPTPYKDTTNRLSSLDSRKVFAIIKRYRNRVDPPAVRTTPSLTGMAARVAGTVKGLDLDSLPLHLQDLIKYVYKCSSCNQHVNPPKMKTAKGSGTKAQPAKEPECEADQSVLVTASDDEQDLKPFEVEKKKRDAREEEVLQKAEEARWTNEKMLVASLTQNASWLPPFHEPLMWNDWHGIYRTREAPFQRAWRNHSGRVEDYMGGYERAQEEDPTVGSVKDEMDSQWRFCLPCGLSHLNLWSLVASDETKDEDTPPPCQCAVCEYERDDVKMMQNREQKGSKYYLRFTG